MHILEKYAIDSLAKIDKPYVYEKYFPIIFDKYITFEPENKNRQKYIYWADVIDLIAPYLLDKNINIVQLNGQQLNKCYNVSQQADFNNKAYIIRNSILHFGVDGFGAQVASNFGKNTVTIYGDYPPQNKKPYWSNKGALSDIHKYSSQKPLYNLDGECVVNQIHPEEIAIKILNILNIKYDSMINTKYIGRNYTNKTFEVIPDAAINTPDNLENLIIRMDYSYDENFLSFYLSQKKCSIITDKPINLKLLNAYKDNIITIIYVIEDYNNPLFVEELKSAGISYEMVSYLNEENLNKFKLKYLDLGLIYTKDTQIISEDLINQKELYFKSSKDTGK